MTLMADALGYRRLRAPRASGGILIDPPLESAPEMIAAVSANRSASGYDFQGKRLPELGELARRELVAAASQYTCGYRDVSHSRDPAAPILLAGHQPELFHPGVWFKNFVLSDLGRRTGATAINLVIDSDTIKTASVRVPTGTPSEPRTVSVPYDHGSPEIPHEERSILDSSLLASFAERVAGTIEPLVSDPLVKTYWPLVRQRAHHTCNLGECLAQARHQLEGKWGQNTLELPQSHVCNLEAFHWFAAHLLANLPRFWEIYNGAIAEYRQANHIRSHSHPVPELATDGAWLEAPFWIWTADKPERHRLFVREYNDQLELTDRGSIQLSLSITPDRDAYRAVEQLAEIARSGIKLRTRALGTTLLARLLLGDAFLHGIGGAKYDQLTDLLISRFFGIQPPEFFAVSATLHLPIQRESYSTERNDASKRLRELEFHPERFIAPADSNGQAAQIEALIAAKRRWIEASPTPENARERCYEIRRINQALQHWLENQRAELIASRTERTKRSRAEAILSSREYSFCLYPEESLRDLMAKAG